MAGPPGEARLGIPYGAATPEGAGTFASCTRGSSFRQFWVDDREAVPKLKPLARSSTKHLNGMETLAHEPDIGARRRKDLLKSGVDGFVHGSRSRR
jgi:hypothetical protein